MRQAKGLLGRKRGREDGRKKKYALTERKTEGLKNIGKLRT